MKPIELEEGNIMVLIIGFWKLKNMKYLAMISKRYMYQWAGSILGWAYYMFAWIDEYMFKYESQQIFILLGI